MEKVISINMCFLSKTHNLIINNTYFLELLSRYSIYHNITITYIYIIYLNYEFFLIDSKRNLLHKKRKKKTKT